MLAAARESSEQAQIAERRDIGQATLEHFRSAVIRLSRESLTGEPVALFAQLRQARDRLHVAAGMHSWPADQREMYFLLGYLNSLMAGAAQDAGSPAAAEELALAGLAYATVTGDKPLTGRLRLDLAIIAYWTGSLPSCLDHAGAGLQQVTGGLTAAQLHLIRARAAARLGDASVASRDINDADQIHAELSTLYQAKLAAHPGATADERLRLLTEARSEYEGPVGVHYFDTTFSLDKTISLAHASALASAIEAKQAGDLRLAAEWEERAAGIWAEIEKSVRLYIGYMQQETGFVRTGHHGRRIDGLDTGRVEDAHEIPVAIFPQHTSRNGDPQLHVHVLWLNKVRTVRDDQWRAVDARGLYRPKGAGSALAAFALETGLTRRFGFEWAYRPASKGRVIAGFPEKAIAQFSSRRAQIAKTTPELAQEYERDRGHPPDQRALASMRQFANSRSRRPKHAGPLDFSRLLREWEKTSRDAELGTLRDLARTIWCAAPRAHADATRMAAQLASRGELTHAQEHAAMTAGLAHAQESRAACGRAHLIHCIARHLPDHAIGRDQEHAWQILQDLTDRALAGHAGEDVLRLDAPEWPQVPDTLRRASGESIYRPHGTELYATRSQLSLEQQLLADAHQQTTPHLTPEQAALALGADLTQLRKQLHAQSPASERATSTGLRLDQATAAYLALTSPRRVELIVGPARPTPPSASPAPGATRAWAACTASPPRRLRQSEIDERRSLRIPAEEPDEMVLGEAWPVISR